MSQIIICLRYTLHHCLHLVLLYPMIATVAGILSVTCRQGTKVTRTLLNGALMTGNGWVWRYGRMHAMTRAGRSAPLRTCLVWQSHRLTFCCSSVSNGNVLCNQFQLYSTCTATNASTSCEVSCIHVLVFTSKQSDSTFNMFSHNRSCIHAWIKSISCVCKATSYTVSITQYDCWTCIHSTCCQEFVIVECRIYVVRDAPQFSLVYWNT